MITIKKTPAAATATAKKELAQQLGVSISTIYKNEVAPLRGDASGHVECECGQTAYRIVTVLFKKEIKGHTWNSKIVGICPHCGE